jgi:predicted NBD/HSP70 family sugar kinase
VTYIYEDYSYWSKEKGYSTHKRKSIGKLDENGNRVYNKYYLDKLAAIKAGTYVEDDSAILPMPPVPDSRVATESPSVSYTVLVGQKMGLASLFRAVKEKNPSKFEDAQNMFFRIEKDWGVPFAVYNDGDVTALAGMITMNKKGILGVAMGSSEAVGYVNPKGAMTGRISELAFAPVDFNPNAPKCEWSGDAGVGAMAFSQQAVNWLAEKFGFKFPKTMALPERLKVVQAAMAEGDEKALKVYIQIGRFLAHAIPWYNEFYDYENMMILGRVTSGLGGSIILETAKTTLKDCYPEWAEKIDIFMPDEKARRLGQSVAAAQIPVIGKGKGKKRK